MNRQRIPFDELGGEAPVRALAERFYDAMDRTEPALARLHPLDEQGRVSRHSRDRFALFLIGWLGGPQDFVAQYGHPQLRRRHAQVPVDLAMRDAWMRCMGLAMEESGVEPELRAYLEVSFAKAASFLRNRAT